MENIQIIDANTTIGIHPKHRLEMSVESLVKEMDKHNIAAGLTISNVAIFHDSQTGNQITLESMKISNRLVPVATVNPKTYFRSPADMQAIKAQGFRIFRFFPIEQEWEISSAAFKEVLKQLSPLNIPFQIDASNSGEPTMIGNAVAGYPAPVILCGVSLDVLSETLAVAADSSNIMIETHELHVPGGLELIAERIGTERIIFGSGAPRRSIASSLRHILNSGLSDQDKALILGGNIKRVLGAK